MIPFATTKEQVKNIAKITATMKTAGINREFIISVAKLAETDQGVYDLMELWFEAKDERDREETIVDLKALFSDYQTTAFV